MDDERAETRGAADARCWQALVERAARAHALGAPNALELTARVSAVATDALEQGLDLLELIDTSRAAYEFVDSLRGDAAGSGRYERHASLQCGQ
jgi:hypothetical protein